jgi:hypothetical protein
MDVTVGYDPSLGGKGLTEPNQLASRRFLAYTGQIVCCPVDLLGFEQTGWMM